MGTGSRIYPEIPPARQLSFETVYLGPTTNRPDGVRSTFKAFLDFWVPLAYSAFVLPQLITVAETPLFQRQAKDVWDEIEREDFVNFIARNPAAGDVIADTGGVRKVRWGRGGSGKRGGARVIYFYQDADLPLYLLMVYAKARQEDLSANEKRAVRKLVGILKS